MMIHVPPSTIALDPVWDVNPFDFMDRQAAWRWMNRFGGELPCIREDGSVESGWMHVWYATLLGYETIRVNLL